jgi:hypothetical protein
MLSHVRIAPLARNAVRSAEAARGEFRLATARIPPLDLTHLPNVHCSLRPGSAPCPAPGYPRPILFIGQEEQPSCFRYCCQLEQQGMDPCSRLRVRGRWQVCPNQASFQVSGQGKRQGVMRVVLLMCSIVCSLASEPSAYVYNTTSPLHFPSHQC